MPNLYSHRENTPNRITCSNIEEAPLPESRKPNSHQDYFLKNRRGTAIRLSRARLTTGLLSQKSKKHRSPNLESGASQQDCFLKNQRGTAFRISKARLPTGLLSQKLKRHHSPNLQSQVAKRIACSKIEEAPLFELQEPDFFR
ncbi:hypothetical protein ACFX16_013784 [Malus domestica]